jgi:uncharacterized protein (TIGR02421 family)
MGAEEEGGDRHEGDAAADAEGVLPPLFHEDGGDGPRLRAAVADDGLLAGEHAEFPALAALAAGGAAVLDAAERAGVRIPPAPPEARPEDAGARSREGAAAPERPRKKKRRVWTTYKERVAQISDAIVRAQRPIRILDALKWDDETVAFLLRTRFRELPKLGRAYYARNPIRFDAEKKIAEFEHVKARARRLVGESDPLGRILIRNAEQYQRAVRMLEARGTRAFYEHSRELYGSPKDRFTDETTSIRDLGRILYETLEGLEELGQGPEYERTLDAEQVVEILNERFSTYFHDTAVHARLDDGIVSDAAAGADYIKIKTGVRFSPRDVDMLEVHEGWAHVGTTLNGKAQHVASWLAKGPPCTTAVQEGLAVFLEIFTFTSQPARAKKLNNRILACDKAEDGANLLEVIEFYRTEGYSELECIGNAQRIFRGGVVKGGAPFTKDISYCKGFIANYNFMRTCIKFGRPHLIPFLFVGKVTHDDVPVLYQKWREGVIDRPKYVPRPFRDLNGIAMWMAYSNFMSRMNLERIQANLKPLILGT